MKVELIGALDYDKLTEYLNKKGKTSEEIDELVEYIKGLTKERKAQIVSSAGLLSRFPGCVSEILKSSENKTYEENVKTIKRICKMGHDSITDHDYCVFKIENVTPIIEQIIIEERFSSFTIKSRREVDFSKSGFYVPEFRNPDGSYHKLNGALKQKYYEHAKNLFSNYERLLSLRVPKEDARFILPYSFYSNIVMGVDAHTLKDMIIKFTKTKYAKITEVREFGTRLYEIAKENIPYLIDIIDEYPENLENGVDTYLKQNIPSGSFKILDKPSLITRTNNVDDTILISSIMRLYQYDFNHAKEIYRQACELNPNFKSELMRKIAFEGDKKELAQVNFGFQIPLSYAVLTHLTRHRTHPIMVSDFTTADLTQVKIPPKIVENEGLLIDFEHIFASNNDLKNIFKSHGVNESDLIYFILSGVMTNAVTNLDGKTMAHILSLRECIKAQWEIREASNGIHKEVSKLEDAKEFSKILGPTCVTQGFCKEGKESCGRILKLKK